MREKPICCVLEKQADGLDNLKNNNSGNKERCKQVARDNAGEKLFFFFFFKIPAFDFLIPNRVARPKLLKVKERTSITARDCCCCSSCVWSGTRRSLDQRPIFHPLEHQTVGGRVSSIERIFFLTLSLFVRCIERQGKSTKFGV